MASITLRNVPEELMTGIRILSERERRSLNSELLVVLEEGFASKAERLEASPLGASLQASLWLDLCGAWKDDRSTEDILSELRASRSEGRDVSL
jgi:plasmid stability protein